MQCQGLSLKGALLPNPLVAPRTLVCLAAIHSATAGPAAYPPPYHRRRRHYLAALQARHSAAGSQHLAEAAAAAALGGSKCLCSSHSGISYTP